MAETLTRRRLSVPRAALTGAVALPLLFVGCWAVAALVTSANMTHNFVGLFTAQPFNSLGALVEGALWSVVMGALIGGLTVFFANLFRV